MVPAESSDLSTSLSERSPLRRPYPGQYAAEMLLNDGTRLQIRPIRPEDESVLARFHATLSEASVYKRYFLLLPFEFRTRHERLMRLCCIDYDRHMALIAERSSQREIVGVGRLIQSAWRNEAEIAVIVCDAFQHKGIGRALVRRLIQFACDKKIQLLTASVLVENVAMRKLLEGEGFTSENDSVSEVWEGQLPLNCRRHGS